METLIERAEGDPDQTANALWTLGLLGARGVEADRVKETLIPYLKDPREEVGLDDTTRGFVFHALRDVTGRSFGKDPAAWRAWWDQTAGNRAE